MTFNLFTTGARLLEKIQECFKNADLTLDDMPPAYFRIFHILNYWIENYWIDFEADRDLQKTLDSFILGIKHTQLATSLGSLIRKMKAGAEKISIEPAFANAPKPLLPKLLSKNKSHTEMSSSQTSLSLHNSQQDVAEPQSPAKNRPASLLWTSFPTLLKQKTNEDFLSPTGLKFMDFEPLEIARQLTLIEFDLFSAIQPRELLELGWMKPNKEEISYNLVEMIKWSNRTVNWIISEIVSARESAKNRALILERVIMLAYHLDKLRNFNGLKEVIAALQSSAVYRLKKTKSVCRM